jgi:microcystin-dependent protein
MKKNLKLLIIIILFVVINIKKKENFRQVLDWPSRTVLIWGGNLNDIPNGWALCNGTNDTPDLRGRFVLGYKENVYNIDRKDGEEKVTLTISQMPSHKHSYSQGGAFRVWEKSCRGHEVGDAPWARPHWKTTSYTGLSQSHNNMPPYYVLAYIMKL